MGNSCLPCLGCRPSSQSAPQPPSHPPPDPTSQSAPHPSPDPASQSAPPPPNSQVQIVDYKKQFGNIQDATQLDPLIDYVGQLLSGIKKPEQSGQSTKPESSKTGEFVTDNVEGASKLLEHISTEGEALHKNIVESKLPEEMRNVAGRVLKGLGNLHWIAVGFSMIAFVLERIQLVSSNSEKCVQLLDRMFDLAKRLQEQHRRMPKEIENVNKAVLAIVDGVIACCSCMAEGKFFKYLFASTDEEHLTGIERDIEKVQRELTLMIATDIQAQMPRTHFVSEYRRPADAVGIEHKVDEVIKLLDLRGEAERRAVILYGFGGVGETTLADCVMSQLDLTGFKHSRIQLDEKQSDMKSYQEAIYSNLMKETLHFPDCTAGRQKLQAVLEKESIFIFIDNALTKNQVNELLPSDFSLRAESRMLITTRGLGVIDDLRFRKIDCKEYRVEELPPDAAKEFFREIVWRCKPTNSKVPSISLNKIDAVAEQCRGVPLLLRVYAEYLARHDEAEVCDEMLDTLREGDFEYTDDHLGEKLLYVYDHLRQDDKDAFLDVCIHFHGWSKAEVSYILRKRELNVLLDGALVNIDSSGNVVVHDVLRAMAIKLGKDSQLQSGDDWRTALAEKKEFKGMWLLFGNSDGFDIECQRLSALRVLAVGERIRFTGECRVSLPKLRYLLIEDPEELPVFEGMDALEYAIFRDSKEYSPSFQRLWENFKRVQKLELSVPWLKKFGDDFRFAKSLRELDLNYCIQLEELPCEFDSLSALQTLDLQCCGSLVNLPDGFGNLSALQTLDLHSCESLVSLPDGFGNLSALQTLDLHSCESLWSLPDGFGNLSALQTLDLHSCKSLVSLPDGFGNLNALQTLDLHSCESLVSLLDGFGNLSALQTLDLHSCESLVSLPDGFGNLSVLQTLDLKFCQSLANLPHGFGMLHSLKYLYMSYCSNLRTLSDDFECLMMLEELNVGYCPILDGNSMEKLTKLKSLQRLRIAGSTELEIKYKEMETTNFRFAVLW